MLSVQKQKKPTEHVMFSPARSLFDTKEPILLFLFSELADDFIERSSAKNSEEETSLKFSLLQKFSWQ